MPQRLVFVVLAWAAVVHLNFRARSTSPVPVCTVPYGHWGLKSRQSTGLAGATRLTRGQTLFFIYVEFTFTKGAEVRGGFLQ